MPVNQPSQIGNICPEVSQNEPWSNWCHTEKSKPIDLKYTIPVNDNELPMNLNDRNDVVYQNEFVPHSDRGTPSENILIDFKTKETLTECNLDQTIPNASSYDNKYYSWDNPEELLYNDNLEPLCHKESEKNITEVKIEPKITGNIESNVVSTDISTNIQNLTTKIETFFQDITETMENKIESTQKPIEKKQICKFFSGNEYDVLKDVIVLFFIIGFVLCIIIFVKKFGKSNDIFKDVSEYVKDLLKKI